MSAAGVYDKRHIRADDLTRENMPDGFRRRFFFSPLSFAFSLPATTSFHATNPPPPPSPPVQRRRPPMPPSPPSAMVVADVTFTQFSRFFLHLFIYLRR